MASVFSGSSKVIVGGKYRDSTRDLTTPSTPIALEWPDTWVSGTALLIYEDTLALAAAAQNRDLYGSLTDMHGNTMNFAKIRGIMVRNKSETAGEVLHVSGNFFTGALLTGWADDAVKLIVHPLGTLFISAANVGTATDSYDVDDTTKERITFDPGANTFDVDFVIWGSA